MEVDTETGKVRVTKMVNATDCGKAINPPAVEGQIEGCFSQGMSQALFEEMIFDNKGRHLNTNYNDYKLATISDHPSFENNQSIIVECPHEPDRMWGAKGVAEAPVTPISAAISNAIYDAIGVRVFDTPMTPEKILKALGKIK